MDLKIPIPDIKHRIKNTNKVKENTNHFIENDDSNIEIHFWQKQKTVVAFDKSEILLDVGDYKDTQKSVPLYIEN